MPVDLKGNGRKALMPTAQHVQGRGNTEHGADLQVGSVVLPYCRIPCGATSGVTRLTPSVGKQDWKR